jgi:hypothetical protein
MDVIIWANEDGNVSVCWPSKTMPIADVKAKDTPEHSIIVDSESLPYSENDFYDAWELSNGVVTVNITKAKNITKDRLRAERAPLLIAQDVAFQRALETNADTSAIVAEKQRLRDVPNLADTCTTTAELRALTV